MLLTSLLGPIRNLVKLLLQSQTLSSPLPLICLANDHHLSLLFLQLLNLRYQLGVEFLVFSIVAWEQNRLLKM